MSGGTIHSGLLDGAAPLIRALGGDPVALAQACGLPPEALETDGLALPGAPVLRFLERAAETCDAPDFALRMATARGGLHMLGPVWVVMSSAATIGEALTLGARMLPFRTTALVARIALEGDMGALEMDSNTGEARDVQAIEFCLAVVVFQLRTWLGAGWRPLTTQFRHASPDDRSRHAAVFGHSVQFDQDRNAVVLDRLSWRAPLPGADRRANNILAAALNHEPSLAGGDLERRVVQQLRAALPHSRVTLAQTAKDLGLPPRTLQYKLHSLGLTFHGLLDEVRTELAVRYLRSSSLTAYQIGELLQFADSSAFSRFLKQKTGRSPREVRREEPRPAAP